MPWDWNSFRKAFRFEIILIRNLIFWFLTLFCAALLFNSGRIARAEWGQVWVAFRAEGYIISIFYVIKTVMELFNGLLDTWQELSKKWRRR